MQLFRPSSGKGTDKAVYSNSKDFIYFPTYITTNTDLPTSTNCIGKWFDGPCALAQKYDEDVKPILPPDISEYIVEYDERAANVFHLPTGPITIHPSPSTSLTSPGKQKLYKLRKDYGYFNTRGTLHWYHLLIVFIIIHSSF